MARWGVLKDLLDIDGIAVIAHRLGPDQRSEDGLLGPVDRRMEPHRARAQPGVYLPLHGLTQADAMARSTALDSSRM
jgi:hypothetical protein